MALNLSASRTKGIPSNARDFLTEYNDRAMDVMTPRGHCIVPPTKLLARLAEERSVADEQLFSETEVQSGLAELTRVDLMIAEAKAGDEQIRSISGQAEKTIAHTPLFLRTLGQLVGAMLPMLVLLFGILAWILHSGYRLPFLIPALVAYFYGTIDLLMGALNPARFFYEYERSNAVNAFRTPVAYAARSFALLFFAFVVICRVAWDMTGGEFMLATSAKPAPWIAYGFDNVVRSLGLDFAEIYRFDLSSIDHGAGLLPASLVFAFRTTIGLSAVSLVIRRLGATRGSASYDPDGRKQFAIEALLNHVQKGRAGRRRRPARSVGEDALGQPGPGAGQVTGRVRCNAAALSGGQRGPRRLAALTGQRSRDLRAAAGRRR